MYELLESESVVDKKQFYGDGISKNTAFLSTRKVLVCSGETVQKFPLFSFEWGLDSYQLSLPTPVPLRWPGKVWTEDVGNLVWWLLQNNG